jgi:hypothetical protein
LKKYHAAAAVAVGGSDAKEMQLGSELDPKAMYEAEARGMKKGGKVSPPHPVQTE